jgi:hypothetical protein
MGKVNLRKFNILDGIICAVIYGIALSVNGLTFGLDGWVKFVILILSIAASFYLPILYCRFTKVDGFEELESFDAKKLFKISPIKITRNEFLFFIGIILCISTVLRGIWDGVYNSGIVDHNLIESHAPISDYIFASVVGVYAALIVDWIILTGLLFEQPSVSLHIHMLGSSLSWFVGLILIGASFNIGKQTQFKSHEDDKIFKRNQKIIKCKGCNKKLRIPSLKRVKVTCPKCFSSWVHTPPSV